MFLNKNKAQIINTTNISIAEQVLNYEIIPENSLQTKIDYFITPYNKKICIKKHMDFGKSILTSDEILKVMNGEDVETNSK